MAPLILLRIPDALIAATACARGARLVTGNLRHYRFIPDLDVALPAYREPPGEQP